MNDKALISLLEKIRAGIGVEQSNIELKRQWWNLNSEVESSEFIKDICALANTQQGDSYIVLGIDETGELFDAPMPDDEANIQAEHKDAIEPRVKIIINEYLIEDKTLSVITIPHSQNRPHVIKKHSERENYIPIRFGSSTLTASRSDLDEMYQERNRANQADLHIRLYEEKIRYGYYSAFEGCCFLIRLSVDNYGGGAPDYIVNAVLTGHLINESWKSRYFMFEGQMLGEEFKINAHDRKQAIQLYLNDHPPSQETNCQLPHFANKKLDLKLYTRSGETIEMTIDPEWLVRK